MPIMLQTNDHSCMKQFEENIRWHFVCLFVWAKLIKLKVKQFLIFSTFVYETFTKRLRNIYLWLQWDNINVCVAVNRHTSSIEKYFLANNKRQFANAHSAIDLVNIPTVGSVSMIRLTMSINVLFKFLSKHFRIERKCWSLNVAKSFWAGFNSSQSE